MYRDIHVAQNEWNKNKFRGNLAINSGNAIIVDGNCRDDPLVAPA